MHLYNEVHVLRYYDVHWFYMHALTKNYFIRNHFAVLDVC